MSEGEHRDDEKPGPGGNVDPERSETRVNDWVIEEIHHTEQILYESRMRRLKSERARAGAPLLFEKVWRSIEEVEVAVVEATNEVADEMAPGPAVDQLGPPPVGEALIGLFCSRDMREAILGDLEEKFAQLAERHGAGVARAWYWGQAGRSVLFFALRWGRRLLELEAILKRIL